MCILENKCKLFQMWTAIVDHDDSHCFVTPLNRSITLPPKTFMEFVKEQQKIGVNFTEKDFPNLQNCYLKFM